MKTYYSVITKVHDDGSVECKRDDEKAFREKPDNLSISMSCYDLYQDWFETAEDADAFIAQARTA